MSAELERTVLTEVVQLHPELLTIPELVLRIASDPQDKSMTEKVGLAARELRRSSLVRYRNDDEVVEPTHAALRTHELFTA